MFAGRGSGDAYFNDEVMAGWHMECDDTGVSWNAQL